jgi:hypothetical protein
MASFVGSNIGQLGNQFRHDLFGCLVSVIGNFHQWIEGVVGFNIETHDIIDFLSFYPLIDGIPLAKNVHRGIQNNLMEIGYIFAAPGLDFGDQTDRTADHVDTLIGYQLAQAGIAHTNFYSVGGGMAQVIAKDLPRHFAVEENNVVMTFFKMLAQQLADGCLPGTGQAGNPIYVAIDYHVYISVGLN